MTQEDATQTITKKNSSANSVCESTRQRCIAALSSRDLRISRLRSNRIRIESGVTIRIQIESRIESTPTNIKCSNYKWNKRDVRNYRFLIPILKHIREFLNRSITFESNRIGKADSNSNRISKLRRSLPTIKHLFCDARPAPFPPKRSKLRRQHNQHWSLPVTTHLMNIIYTNRVVPSLYYQLSVSSERWYVCKLHRGSNCSLARATDGRIMRCSVISSCQSAATSEIVKRSWAWHCVHRGAISSTGSLHRPEPIYCNCQFAHYSGFCRISPSISPSILNRFKPNLQA